jgi:hypothetical protein
MAVQPEAPETPEVAEVVEESLPPQLSPQASVDHKMKELEAKGAADLSTGQRIGARLMAMAELRNR